MKTTMIVREKKLRFQTLALLIIITIIAVYFFTLNSQESVEDEVTVEQVRAMIDKADSVVFLDVRRESEFRGPHGHLEGAILIPLSDLKSRIEEIEIYRDHKIIIYCLGAYMFYYLLFKSKLIPRFISVWGLIAVAILFTEMMLITFGDSLRMILMIPMGLNEIFLGIWLIVKGFNLTQTNSYSGD